MNSIIAYGLIFIILLVLELGYFMVADKFNIIDKPNERSSHSTIVLRGGGIIYALSTLVWLGVQMVSGDVLGIKDYIPFIIGLMLIAGVSFVDDIHSLPDSVRLVAQFVAMGLMFWSIGLFDEFQVTEGSIVSGMLLPALFVVIAFIVCVGATNIINFMDGINGITAGYSLSVLVPLLFLNTSCTNLMNVCGFVDSSLIIVVILADVVFSIFNFRPKGKAKCFAGDVGSIGIAFILLFYIGKLIMQTGDITWLIFLLVYGVDGCLTICHRIILHENLGEAHRKHVFQLMANELKMSHIMVSLIYMELQLVVSLGFIYFCPNTVVAHWCYLVCTFVVLAVAYVLFKKKYYHLHEEYLASLKK